MAAKSKRRKSTSRFQYATTSSCCCQTEILRIIMKCLIGSGNNDLYNLCCVCKRFTALSRNFIWDVIGPFQQKGIETDFNVSAIVDQVMKLVNEEGDDNNNNDNNRRMFLRYRSGGYSGEVVDKNGNSIPNGLGLFGVLHDNEVTTEFYFGQWQDGCKHGSGRYFHDKDNIRRNYYGDFFKGQRHGFGIHWTNNDSEDAYDTYYTGGYENNVRCGVGMTFRIYDNGVRREYQYGRYNNDKPIGYHMRFYFEVAGNTVTNGTYTLKNFGNFEMTPSSNRIKTNNNNCGG